MADEKGPAFAVVAEKRDYPQPLFMMGLPLEQLYRDIVTKYEEGNPFFIDGVPVSKTDLLRIKIVRQKADFEAKLNELHWNVRFLNRDSGRFIPIADYPGRLVALFRECGTDVTSNVIDAYQAKKKLKIPVDQIVDAASKMAIELMKMAG